MKVGYLQPQIERDIEIIITENQAKVLHYLLGMQCLNQYYKIGTQLGINKETAGTVNDLYYNLNDILK